jgi:hypothetical protein
MASSRMLRDLALGRPLPVTAQPDREVSLQTRLSRS